MIKYLPIAVLILNIADSLTTYFIIKDGGEELNLIMDKLFKTIGLVPALMLKTMLIFGISVGVALYIPMLNVGIVMLYFIVVVWNIDQVMK